jgi:hypothetical protein
VIRGKLSDQETELGLGPTLRALNGFLIPRLIGFDLAPTDRARNGGTAVFVGPVIGREVPFKGHALDGELSGGAREALKLDPELSLLVRPKVAGGRGSGGVSFEHARWRMHETRCRLAAYVLSSYG